MFDGKSMIYIEESRGPKTVLSETPEVTFDLVEKFPSRWYRSVRKHLIQNNIRPRIP